MPIYRNREQPYQDPANPDLKSMRVYFYDHQPGEWLYDPGTVEIFRSIYGDDAVLTLQNRGTVPENTDEKWVTKPVFSDPPAPPPDHTGEILISTPMGYKWVKKELVDNSTESRLGRIEAKVDKLLLK